MKTVGIIGGSGLIGSHITKKFLEEGYSVKVSVANIKKSENYKHLFNYQNSDNLNISTLQADDLDVLKNFINDCEILIHCGTPYTLAVKETRTGLFDQSEKDTEHFLKAIMGSSAFEKAVFIISVATWNDNFPLPLATKKNSPIDETK